MLIKNKKGFTLVEILIAVAIASIIILAAGRLLTAVLNQYNKDSYDVKLQTEVEEIINLVENWVMDANSISTGGEGVALKITKNTGTGGTFTSSIFVSNNKLYYSNQAGDSVLIGSYVDNVSFRTSESGRALYMTLDMSFGTSVYNASRKILLRNALSEGEAAYSGEQGTSAATQTTAAPQVETKNDPATEIITDPSPENNTPATEPETEPQTQPQTQPAQETPVIPVTPSNSRVDVINTTTKSANKKVEFSFDVRNNGVSLDRGKFSLRVYYYYTYKGQNQSFGGNWSATSDFSSLQIKDVPLTSYYSQSGYSTCFGYLDINTSGLSGLLAMGEKLNVKINLDINWNNCNNLDFSMKTAYEGFESTGLPEVVVYYEGISDPLYGQIPEPVLAPKLSIISNTATLNSDGTINIQFKVKKTGKNINWQNLYLKYFWLDNVSDYIYYNYQNQLELVSLSCSSENNNGPSQVTKTEQPRPQWNNFEKKEGANAFVKLQFNGVNGSAPTEIVTVNMTVKCDRPDYIKDSYNLWYSTPKSGNTAANNNLLIYGEYYGESNQTFGNLPSGNYKEIKFAQLLSGNDGIYNICGTPDKIIIKYTESNNKNKVSSVIIYKDNSKNEILAQVSSQGKGDNIEKTIVITSWPQYLSQFYAESANVSDVQIAVIYK